MRIGIDARFLQSTRRGQGQYVYYLIKELLKLDGGSEYVAFYNGLKTGEFAFDPATPRLRQVWCNVPGTILRQTWHRFRLPRIENMIGAIDVFHNPTNFSFTHYGLIPSRAPMAVTFNGMAHPSTIWGAYDEKKLDGWFREAAASASIVIAVSEMVKKDLQQRVKIPDERIRVIHYGVSEEFKPMDDKPALGNRLAKYAIAGKKYMLYTGAAEPNKNLSMLLDVFCGLSKMSELADLCLVLAGPMNEPYRKLAEKTTALGIAQKVIFTGYVGHDDLPYLYNGAEAFVLPTLTEWFGIPVLEAMACGVPAAVSKNTGALDAAGDSVLTFDPRNAIDMSRCMREVILNGPLRERLKAKGLERVKGCSWSQTARKTLDAYKELYSAGKR
jgi:glycosyltransferase involved in cell wall biosynthesis